MNTFTFNLQSEKDIDSVISQLGRLLIELNQEKCIYKYKFYLSIDSDSVIFDKEGPIKISNDFFEKYQIPYIWETSPNIGDKGLIHSFRKVFIVMKSNSIKDLEIFKNLTLKFCEK